MRIPTHETPVFITQLQCGGRYMLLIAGQELHHPMVKSFQCKPDPAAEATLADVQVDLQLELPGWSMVSRGDNQLQLSNGSSHLILQPMLSSTSAKALRAMTPGFLSYFKGVTVDASVDNQLRLGGTLEGSPVVGWAKLIPCPASKTLAIALSPDKTEADALELAVAKATCRSAGAPYQTWPDAPPVGAAKPPEASDTAPGEAAPAAAN